MDIFGLYRVALQQQGVIVPRVIAVGQHGSSALRNPFLSQRLKCETTGRSATAPELDDEGSSRGAAYRCTHIGRGHNATTHSFLSLALAISHNASVSNKLCRESLLHLSNYTAATQAS